MHERREGSNGITTRRVGRQLCSIVRMMVWMGQDVDNGILVQTAVEDGFHKPSL